MIKELREQGTEMMRGVDWAAVEAYVDLRKTLNKVRGPDSVVSCPRCRGDLLMGSCVTCVHSVKACGESCLYNSVVFFEMPLSAVTLSIRCFLTPLRANLKTQRICLQPRRILSSNLNSDRAAAS